MKKIILSGCLFAVAVLIIGGIVFLFSDPDPDTKRDLIIIAIGAPFVAILAWDYRTRSKFQAVPKRDNRIMPVVAGIAIFAAVLLCS
jgi:hypothetical protein